MTERLTIQCFEPVQSHAAMTKTIWPMLKSMLMAGHRMTLTLAREKRSDAQNRVLWARLTDVSEQVDWYGRKLTAEDWKHVTSASLRKMDVVPNLEGTGFVALGLSTSVMSKAELQDLNELIIAFGTQKGVNWSIASLCGQTE